MPSTWYVAMRSIYRAWKWVPSADSRNLTGKLMRRAPAFSRVDSNALSVASTIRPWLIYCVVETSGE
jgi:hypothetical protein